jgi:hypothetical protein
VDTATPKYPTARWLVLVLLVLLVHLGLLQSMPLALNPGGSAIDPAMRFATRTLVLPPVLDPAPVAPTQVLAAPAKVRRTAKPLPDTIAPVPDPGAPPGSLAHDSVHGSSSEPDHAPSSALTTAAATPLAALEPQEPDPAPRPPRDKPPKFSLDTLTGSARLLYKVHANKFPFTLNGELLWRNQGANYTARMGYSAFGQSRTQVSRGHITDVGLAPERFSDKFRSEVAAHFNYLQGKVTFSANTPDAPLLTGAQDRLSVLVQLGALVASEPERYGPGTTLTIQTIGPRDADLWLFTFDATETLELPGGTLQGLKLVRNPRQPYDQKVEVWLAAALGYLPARIRITETNGDAIDQQWASTEPVDNAD